MMKPHYKATVLREKLREQHTHFPVIADVDLQRRQCSIPPRRKVRRWNLSRLRANDPQITDEFRRKCEEKVLNSTLPAQVSRDTPAEIDASSNLLTKLLAAAAKETIGETYHFTHSRTHRLDKRLAKKQKAVNAHRKRHWSQLNKVHSVEAIQLKKLRQEAKDLSQNIHESRIECITAQLNVEHSANHKRRVTALAKEITKHPGDLPENPHINAIRDDRGIIHTNTNEIHEIFRKSWGDYFTHPAQKDFRTQMPISTNKNKIDMFKKTFAKMKKKIGTGTYYL